VKILYRKCLTRSSKESKEAELSFVEIYYKKRPLSIQQPVCIKKEMTGFRGLDIEHFGINESLTENYNVFFTFS
jgi:hypothetical protein